MNDQQPLGDNESSKQLTILFISFMAGVFVIYYVAEEKICDGLLFLARVNISFLDFVANIPVIGTHIANIFQPGLTVDNLSELSKWVYLRHGYELMGTDQVALLGFIGSTVRPFIIPIIVLQVITHIRYQRVRAFKKSYTIQKLAKESRTYLPHLIPPLSLDLLSIPIDIGQLARAKSPLRYCIENGLINVYKINLRGEIDTTGMLKPTFSKTKGTLPGYLFIKEKVDDPQGQRSIFKRCAFVSDELLTSHFVEQLGKKMSSVYDMSKTRRIILAMTLLMAQGASKDGVKHSYNLNQRVNRSFKLNKKLNKKGFTPFIAILDSDKIIEKYINHPLFQKALEENAYELTFLTSAIHIARKYGKFFTSHNYWIKYFERDLWFTFHQAGSETAWTESVSVRSHHLWEQKCNIGLDEPCVDKAVIALKKYMTVTENWIYKEGYQPE